MWMLFALLCIGVGLVMFSGIQSQLPDELSFLKSKPPTSSAVVESGSVQEAQALPAVTASAWTVESSADGVEISRDFANEIRSASQRYDRPTFYLTCYRQVLYARIDTRLHTKGRSQAKVIWQGNPQIWVHGEGQNIFAPDAAQVLRSLHQQTAATASLEFEEAPRQTLTLHLTGLDRALTVLGKSCRLP